MNKFYYWFQHQTKKLCICSWLIIFNEVIINTRNSPYVHARWNPPYIASTRYTSLCNGWGVTPSTAGLGFPPLLTPEMGWPPPSRPPHPHPPNINIQTAMKTVLSLILRTWLVMTCDSFTNIPSSLYLASVCRTLISSDPVTSHVPQPDKEHSKDALVPEHLSLEISWKVVNGNFLHELCTHYCVTPCIESCTNMIGNYFSPCHQIGVHQFPNFVKQSKSRRL